ncbi:alpha/beta fold hydrolase [Yoonia sp. 208BN28-4]|uniref:alpha/beta fold hydrolase n=1 Tax=Yoonia sp. 208BN28-4 TaxID=3126505 RepID=UPI0030A334B6
MRRLIPLFLIVLTGCFGIPYTDQSPQDPLRFDATEVAQADKLAIFIPGVLSSVNIFDDTDQFADAGFARVFYRYPGLDDLPLDHRLTPESAAARVATFANRYPDKDIALIGYSTGGPVALLAADQIDNPERVRIAAMSTAVEYGGGVPTALRGLQDIARAVIATGTLDQSKIWERFWAGLLYGPAAFDDPAFADRLERDIAEGEKIYVKLDPVLAISHVLALPNWELPDDLDLGDIPVAFFVGLNDRVFSTAQTLEFADQVGDVPVYGYPDQGHLLFFTRPDVYDDILRFAQGRDVIPQ